MLLSLIVLRIIAVCLAIWLRLILSDLVAMTYGVNPAARTQSNIMTSLSDGSCLISTKRKTAVSFRPGKMLLSEEMAVESSCGWWA